MSRFLNVYPWSTHQVIRTTRQLVVRQILSQRRWGCRPSLQVIIDLTTLEKKVSSRHWMESVRVYHSKQGLHLVVLYLVMGQWRGPWSLRVYWGKDTLTPAQLRLRLLNGLPKALTQRFEM